MIDSITMKGKNNNSFSIAEADTTAVTQQAHGYRKMRHLVCESVY